MPQRKHNAGFRPRATYNQPALKPGMKLEPKVDNSEEVIEANPVLAGFVARYGRATTQGRVRYGAYSNGWADAFTTFEKVYGAINSAKLAEDAAASLVEQEAGGVPTPREELVRS